MIISDTYKIAFVHIPKCGGTSVRSALRRFDDRAERYFDKGRAVHKDLGELDHHHIPLATLKDFFAEDFECVARYTAFAIVRNPYERFPSSVFQRLRAPKAIQFSTDDVRREVDEVIEYLLSLPRDVPILAPDLIHFSRQRDYVYLGERRIVDHVYPLNQIRQLITALSDVTNENITPVQRENERLQFSNDTLEAADRWIQARIMNNIPRRVWKPVFTVAKNGLIRAGVLNRPDDWHSVAFQSKDVQRFIREFYADDIKLYSDCVRDCGKDLQLSGVTDSQ